MKDNKNKIFVALCILIVVCIIGSISVEKRQKWDNVRESYKESIDNTETENTTKKDETENDEMSFEHDSKNVKKFQDLYSMDWDFIDAGYLLKIAEYHGGSEEDRAYTILVTLYRVFDQAKYNHNVSIQDIVLDELYNNDGLTAFDFEAIYPTDTTRRAMNKILYDRFDNCNGSMEYIEFYETDNNNVDN